MRRAFVSHSSSDDRYVAEMESFLRAAGFEEVFNDVSAIRPDKKFWPEIEKGIADADTFVVVITSASNASEWVKREIEYARGLSKKIIPIWIENCPVPPIFADRDVIDFRPRTHAGRRFDISRIVKYAPADLIGRDDETKFLSDAWQKVLRVEKGRPHVLTFVALGGEGKTSLVAKWAAKLAHQDWPGCDAAFAWSFYSQGTREQVAASSDLFLKEALTFFGDHADKEFAASAAGAYEKGQRLARVIGLRRCLLILDGLEPLQYAPTSPTPGQLKDQGITALLKGLAAAGHGLCVVTTRYSLPDLRAFWQTTAPEVKLLRLSREAGVHLLQSIGVNGSLLRNIPFHREQVNEFEKLVEDVQGHALTLNLFGTYLRDAHGGDIRKRDLVNLEEADAEEQGGHAFRVMEAYEREFECEGDKGQRALAVLRLLGLFDRPVTSGNLCALLRSPAIAGFTEPLIDLTEAQRNIAFKRLEDARLLTVNRHASGALDTLDAHPLLREYFTRQLRTQQPGAWRSAHRRLYEHLCATTKEGDQPTLEDLQPLYQAVAHGCRAGLQQETFDDVYRARITRGEEYYSAFKLGAFGLNLGAIACFFESPWSYVLPGLSETTRAWLLGTVAFHLRALGRPTEAIQPLKAGIEGAASVKDWHNAAIYSHNLNKLTLTLGNVAEAVRHAEQSVAYADRSGDEYWPIHMRARLADVLHQAGCWSEAEALFRQTELSNAADRSEYSLLHWRVGFLYCDLLLTAPERAAWHCSYYSSVRRPYPSSLRKSCGAVLKRAEQTLKREEGRRGLPLLDFALHNLTLGRAGFYATILNQSADALDTTTELFTRGDYLHNRLTKASAETNIAVDGLRRAGDTTRLPLGLLTRAWLRFLTGARIGPESAQADLDEAWEIAERGPMKLFLADTHLHRARLFFREAQYPWESPRADLAAAEKLINDCGYHRRDEELADAKRAILGE